MNTTTNTETVYRLSNSNGLQGPAWRTDYETQEAAAEALGRAMRWESVILSDSFADGTGEADRDGWIERDAVCAYETQEECDRDGDGARAPRITRWRRQVSSMTTAEAITDRQIRALREDALAAGDYEQVDICNRALVKDGETQDQDGAPIAYADMTQDEARAECARVISDAEAAAR